nr:hypothetical protein [uncultured Rhodoferax sp.]
MRNPTFFATFLVAACAISTGASAQKVYKCGNTYSQMPCGNEHILDTGEPSTASPAMRQQAIDKENKRQAAAANALEKARVAQEAEAVKHRQAILQSIKEDKAKVARSADKTRTSGKTAKKNKKEPEYFTAKQAPSDKP